MTDMHPATRDRIAAENDLKERIRDLVRKKALREAYEEQWGIVTQGIQILVEKANEEVLDEHRQFVESLTQALNAHGVPAMPSWQEAIDYLATHGGQKAETEVGQTLGARTQMRYASDLGFIAKALLEHRRTSVDLGGGVIRDSLAEGGMYERLEKISQRDRGDLR